MNIFGFEIKIREDIPTGEIWFENEQGIVVGKIVNITTE